MIAEWLSSQCERHWPHCGKCSLNGKNGLKNCSKGPTKFFSMHRSEYGKMVVLVNVFAVLVLLTSVVEAVAYTQAALEDRVTNLPGATSALMSNQFSGYLNVSSTRGIHYMYFESERDPATDSVIFWTNGGPGCSGLLGLYTEFGPWRAASNLTLIRNPFSWTRYANIVFLEQPVGVGFSYANPPISPTGYNDFMASKDNLLVVKSFFQRYPERAQNDFYLASESYGGHYIPQWTLQVLGDEQLRPRFKGYLLGNPFTSYGSGSIAMANALWGLQLVPKPLWDSFADHGCDSLFNSAYDLSQECFDIMDALFTYVDDLNPYALDYPTCIIQGIRRASQATQTHTHTHTQTQTQTQAQPLDTTEQQASAVRRLGPQAQMFLHMHARLKQSPAYQEYRKGLRPRAAMKSALEARKREQSRSAAEAGAVEQGVGLEGEPGGDMPTLTRSRTVLQPHQYAAFAKPPADATTEAATAVGAGAAGEGRVRTVAFGGQPLSEESEFRYDPCTQYNTVVYLNNAKVQEALHVRYIPGAEPQLVATTEEGEAVDVASSGSQDVEWPDRDAHHGDTSATAAAAAAAAHQAESQAYAPPQPLRAPGKGRKWDYCSNEVNRGWAFNDYLGDTTELYRRIYQHPHKPRGFKMLIYSGDVDGVCATVGTQHWIYNVTSTPPTSLFKTWTYEDVNYGTQLGGYLTKFKDSLSFMTVRYAGHEVPAYQPQPALELLRTFLDGSIFDTSLAAKH